MDLVIDPDGVVRCVYGEAIALRELGELTIRRASHVEPDAEGKWWADLSPVGGPVLGPFDLRGEALEHEAAWLNEHWLGRLTHEHPDREGTAWHACFTTSTWLPSRISRTPIM